MTLDCEVVLTRSGAPAMRDRTTGEIMHPVVGPLVEAERLYVGPSQLVDRLGGDGPDPLVLLDVGLGAGSNAIAAWHASQNLATTARRLEIVSFDRSVAALELALDPAHASAFGLDSDAGSAARELLATGHHENARTSWRLVKGDLPSALTAVTEANVVFWDPFSPRASPDLWSLAAFRTLRRSCRSGATVHTYSGSTRIRSALLLAGFVVGIGPEIGEGKRATCAALRREDLATPLDERWLDRLTRSSAPFPADAPADAFRCLSQLAQFR